MKVRFKLFEQTRRDFLSKLGKAAIGAAAPKQLVNAVVNASSTASKFIKGADRINLDSIMNKILAASQYYAARPGADNWEKLRNLRVDPNTPEDVADILSLVHTVDNGMSAFVSSFYKLYKTGVIDDTVSSVFCPGDPVSGVCSLLNNIQGSNLLDIDEEFGMLKPIQFIRRNQPIKVTYTNENGELVKDSSLFGSNEESENLRKQIEQYKREESQWQHGNSQHGNIQQRNSITLKLPKSIAIQLKYTLSKSLNV